MHRKILEQGVHRQLGMNVAISVMRNLSSRREMKRSHETMNSLADEGDRDR